MFIKFLEELERLKKKSAIFCGVELQKIPEMN
jgi:hypothetical protein